MFWFGAKLKQLIYYYSLIVHFKFYAAVTCWNQNHVVSKPLTFRGGKPDTLNCTVFMKVYNSDRCFFSFKMFLVPTSSLIFAMILRSHLADQKCFNFRDENVGNRYKESFVKLAPPPPDRWRANAAAHHCTARKECHIRPFRCSQQFNWRSISKVQKNLLLQDLTIVKLFRKLQF